LGLDFRRHFVARAPLFRGLGRGECEELVALAQDRRVARKASFFRQGDAAVEVMVLCAGRLKLTQVLPGGGELILRLTNPGEAFGALDTASSGAYPVSAEALEASHALAWERSTLDAFAERNTVVLHNQVRIVCERLHSLEQHYAELVTQRVPQRVAQALLRLAVQVGQAVPGGVLVSLSREELAQLAGTTLFTVSRLFGDWEARGLVTPRREGVIVTDAEKLATLIEHAETMAANGDALSHGARAQSRGTGSP
jgi:CRP-like cAMP-binding protein